MNKIPFLFLLFLSFVSSGKLSAGSGTIDGMGNMTFSVNFRYVPTNADITNLQNALNAANVVICDATDGQARFKTITITAGASGEDDADIWVMSEPGRSGVSFFFDGSGFGRAGAHIVLFQSAINGPVIAHELGHLALGLGDEYDEQNRFGDPCGIGPCIDPANIDPRNNSLMQQAAEQTEFCVAANHDPLRGNNSGCGPGCSAADCGENFNSSTARFERSQQHAIHGKSCWETMHENYAATFTVPAGLPVAAVPGNCGSPVFNVKVTGSDQIMLFIDRSGSMIESVTGNPGDQTRLDFAKAAARAFIDLRTSSNAQVGLISFEETPRRDRALINLAVSDATPFKATVDALAAGGNTGIGTALNASIFEFQNALPAGKTKTAFLLSDGENNRGEDPNGAAQRLKDQGVKIFTIPVGNSADRNLLSQIAGTTGGVMLNAPTGDELPPIYFELYARSRGEQLALGRTPVILKPVKRVINLKEVRTNAVLWNIIRTSPGSFDSVTVEVERFAQSLNVMLSVRNMNISKFQPVLLLRSPAGTIYPINNISDSVSFSADNYYILARARTPKAGKWTVFMSTVNTTDVQKMYVIAHVEDPGPDVFVSVKPQMVATTTAPVSIGVTTSYKADLDSGVSYTGFVKRPDGSSVPLLFNRDNNSRGVSAEFNNYTGRGIYEVNISSTATGARLLQGESIFTGPATAPVTIQDFKRNTSTAFFVSEGQDDPKWGDDPVVKGNGKDKNRERLAADKLLAQAQKASNSNAFCDAVKLYTSFFALREKAIPVYTDAELTAAKKAMADARERCRIQ